MRIEIQAETGDAAGAFAEECLVHLARCGVVATRVPDSTVVEIPDAAGPPIVVRAGTDPAILLRQLVTSGAIPAAGAADEELLLARLVDLGYL
jgi:hypothetical protein